MPTSNSLHALVEGQGTVIMLSHALGCDLHMWDEVATLLKPRYTVARYDHRGHGRSPGGHASFTIQDLAADAAAVIDSLGAGPVCFVGLSMGGMTAQALAALYPDRVRSVVIANAASHYGTEAKTAWNARIETVRTQGMESIADAAMQRWFTPEFMASAPARVGRMRSVLTHCDAEAYANACTAVAGIELSKSNPSIDRPTLIIAGTQDQATPWSMSAAIAQQIPGARLRSIDAAHISCVEQPQAFADLVDDFIRSQQ